MVREWPDPAEQLFLEAGYILFSLDNRGTPHRSVRFKTALDRHFGTVEVQDQLAGVAYLKSLPNESGYRAADVLPRLALLKPHRLLILHGMADDNVTFDQSTRVFAALETRALPFETMVYPGLRHRAGWTPENKLHRTLTTLAFFKRTLGAN